jgi:uncharacterized membrane protein HdeD (DUF308 family)
MMAGWGGDPGTLTCQGAAPYSETLPMSGSASPDAHHLAGFPAIRLMARSWWIFVLRGVASILFGLIAFLLPGLGLVLILAFLAAWMIIDGVGSLWQAIRHGEDPAARSRIWLWIDGLVALGAAAVMLFAPGISAFALVIVTGAWFLIAGIARLMLAFRLSSVLLGILGAIGILVGAWLLLQPGPGLLAVIWLIGMEAVAMGVLMIGLGWRLRRVHNDPNDQPGQTPL